MKKSLILCLFVAVTTMANAQLTKEITSENPTTKKSNPSDPMSNFYGKALNLTLHKKGNTNIQHSIDQKMTFFKDGTLETSVGTDHDKGTWTYDSDSFLLTLTLVGNGADEIETYMIKEIQNTKLKLVNGDESFTLYILKKRSNPPVQVLKNAEDN